MDPNVVMLLLFAIVSALAAGVMYGMFRVGTMAHFEMSRLYFAASVLGFLAFIFIFSMIFYAFAPPLSGAGDSPGKIIFDSCTKVIPPIVTLVIGFYFGASPKREDIAPHASKPGDPAAPAP